MSKVRRMKNFKAFLPPLGYTLCDFFLWQSEGGDRVWPLEYKGELPEQCFPLGQTLTWHETQVSPVRCLGGFALESSHR